MNLLDEIVSWNSSRLHAVANGHRSLEHPLRRDGELPITAGIEYAAQAAAAHGALVSGEASQGGMLASIRSMAFHARRLDDITSPLDIFVDQVAAHESGVIYRVAVRAEEAKLLEGQVAIAFRPWHGAPS